MRHIFKEHRKFCNIHTTPDFFEGYFTVDFRVPTSNILQQGSWKNSPGDTTRNTTHGFNGMRSQKWPLMNSSREHMCISTSTFFMMIFNKDGMWCECEAKEKWIFILLLIHITSFLCNVGANASKQNLHSSIVT